MRLETHLFQNSFYIINKNREIIIHTIFLSKVLFVEIFSFVKGFAWTVFQSVVTLHRISKTKHIINN